VVPYSTVEVPLAEVVHVTLTEFELIFVRETADIVIPAMVNVASAL
jgi:hypothetical protein